MRDAIRREVEQVHPVDSLEAAYRVDALAWIDSGAELCRVAKPATPPKHLVSYFPVTDGTALLLGLHRNAGLWLPNGGHVEPGEHPRDTVRREVREELGIEAEFLVSDPLFISISQTVGSTAGHTDVSLWYALLARRDAALNFDREEFSEMRWFGFDALPIDQTDPHLARFVGKMSKMLSLATGELSLRSSD